MFHVWWISTDGVVLKKPNGKLSPCCCLWFCLALPGDWYSSHLVTWPLLPSTSSASWTLFKVGKTCHNVTGFFFFWCRCNWCKTSRLWPDNLCCFCCTSMIWIDSPLENAHIFFLFVFCRFLHLHLFCVMFKKDQRKKFWNPIYINPKVSQLLEICTPVLYTSEDFDVTVQEKLQCLNNSTSMPVNIWNMLTWWKCD